MGELSVWGVIRRTLTSPEYWGALLSNLLTAGIFGWLVYRATGSSDWGMVGLAYCSLISPKRD